MKRFLAFVILVITFIPVVAFAEVNITGNGKLKGSFTDSTNTIFGVFNVSTFTTEQRTIFKNALTGNRGIVSYLYDKSSSKITFRFVDVPSDVNVTYSNNGTYAQLSFSKAIPIVVCSATVNSTYPMSFDIDTTFGNSISKLIYSISSPSTGWIYKLLQYGSDFDTVVNSFPSTCILYTGVDYDGQIMIITDEQDEPLPPDPEPPTPPDIPLIPEIPKYDSVYIPYDTTKWNGFLEKVGESIGSTTNIGFSIFALILSILLLISIIKKFTK